MRHFIIALITIFSFQEAYSQWKLTSQNEILKSSKANGLRTMCFDVSDNQDTITVFGTANDTLIVYFKEGIEKYFLGYKSFMMKCHSDGRKIVLKILPFKAKFNGIIRKDLKQAVLASETDLADTIRVCDLNGNLVTSFINTDGGHKNFTLNEKKELFTISNRYNSIYIIKQNSDYQLTKRNVNLKMTSGSSDYMYIRGIKMLEDENAILVYGNYSGIIDIDASLNQQFLSTTYNRNGNVFLAKYDYDGNLLWSTSFGGSKKEEVANVAFKNGQYIHSFDTQSDTLFVNGNNNRLILPKQSANSLAHVFYPINKDGSIDSTKIKYAFSGQNFNLFRLDGSAATITEAMYQRFEKQTSVYLLSAESTSLPITMYPSATPVLPFNTPQIVASFEYNEGLQLLDKTSDVGSTEASIFPIYFDALEKVDKSNKLGFDGKISLYWLTYPDNKYSILMYERDGSTLGIEKSNMQQSRPVLFPNPSHQMVTILGDNFQSGDIVRFYSSTGNKALETMMNGSDNYVDVSVLKQGIYLYEIYSKGDRISVGRLVID